MTIALSVTAAVLLALLWLTRARREHQWHLARERRRNERERQWRAMIRDADERRRR